MALRTVHLCSGYGGFELGLKAAGVDSRTVCHVEQESFAAATLVARMAEATLDQAPVWDHLESFDGAAWRGRVDLVTAGFPCQPFSQAGHRKGLDDTRWLWPTIAKKIAAMGPSLVFLENVPELVRHGLPVILHDLAGLGFHAEWALLSGLTVGAPHIRERFWLLAHADGLRPIEWRPEHQHPSVKLGNDGGIWPPLPNDIDGWEQWAAGGGPEPTVRRGPDGRPPELVQSLYPGGNGLIPAVAGSAFLMLSERAGLLGVVAPSRDADLVPDRQDH